MSAEAMRHAPSLLRDELISCGILVAAGRGDRGQVQFSFLHRSFLEYLAASELVRRGWKEIKDLVDRNAWRPEWQEVIVMLAGLTDDPKASLELLADEQRDDLFRHRLALTVRCLGEVSQDRRECWPALVDRIVSATFEFCLPGWRWDDSESIGHVTRALPALVGLGSRSLEARLLECLDDRDGTARKAAIVGLGALGPAVGSPELLQRLKSLSSGDRVLQDPVDEAIRRLRYRDRPLSRKRFKVSAIDITDLIDMIVSENPDKRIHAAFRLARMGSVVAQEAIDALVACLGDFDEMVRACVRSALDELDATSEGRTIKPLVKLLNHGDWSVRSDAAKRLGELGPAAAEHEVINALLERLGDVHVGVQISASLALARLATAAGPDLRDELIQTLVAMLEDDGSPVVWSSGPPGAAVTTMGERARAADAMGEMGRVADERIVDALFRHLNDASPLLAASVASSLGQLGDLAKQPRVLSALFAHLNHRDTFVQRCAASALIKLNATGDAELGSRVIDALIALLSHPDSSVRYDVAFGLRSLPIADVGLEQQSRLFLALVRNLRHADPHVRIGAAWSLGPLALTAVSRLRSSVLSVLLWAYHHDNDREVHRATDNGLRHVMAQGIRIKSIDGRLLACPITSLAQGHPRCLAQLRASGTTSWLRKLANWVRTLARRPVPCSDCALSAAMPKPR